MQNLARFKIPPEFRGRSAFVVQMWWIIQSTLFGCSPQFLYGWRRFLLRLFGAKIGQNVIIRPSARITYPWKICIGDYSWIGDDVVLYSLGEITIGKNTVISQRSYLCAASHDYNSEAFDIFAESIEVKDEVWIATDVFVGHGVVIGQGAVIGARSSVFKSMPSEHVCVGSPCEPKKKRCAK